MSGSVTNAVARWQDGDTIAQLDVERGLRPFLLDLLSLVRRRRGTALQARIDSQAVVNEALGSFLTGARKGEFPVLTSREDVRRVLTTLVQRGLCDAIKHHTRGKRAPRKEQASADGRPPDLAGPSTPLDLGVVFADWLEEFQELLRPLHEKAIEVVELSFKDLSNPDIARQLGLGLRSVQQLKKRMADLLEARPAQQD